jgi:hypothetical protein
MWGKLEAIRALDQPLEHLALFHFGLIAILLLC